MVFPERIIFYGHRIVLSTVLKFYGITGGSYCKVNTERSLILYYSRRIILVEEIMKLKIHFEREEHLQSDFCLKVTCPNPDFRI